MDWRMTAYIVFGFLLGSVLFSFLLPKWLCGVDVIAESDDGNPGTANAVKLAGVPVGLLCLLCDMGKGFLPVFLAAGRDGARTMLFAAVMCAPVLGHMFSPWMRGRGGKAISVSFGVLLGVLPVSPIVFLLAGIYIFLSAVVVISPHALRSIVTFIAFAGGAFLLCPVPAVKWGAVAISAAVAGKHAVSGLEGRASVHLLSVRRRTDSE